MSVSLAAGQCQETNNVCDTGGEGGFTGQTYYTMFLVKTNHNINIIYY